MRKTIFAALVCFAAGAAAAEPAVPAIAHCNRARLGYCFEYRKYDEKALGFMRDACDKRSGDVWTEGKPCPEAKQFAYCSRELLGSVTTTFFYPPAASSARACQRGPTCQEVTFVDSSNPGVGTWTRNPALERSDGGSGLPWQATCRGCPGEDRGVGTPARWPTVSAQPERARNRMGKALGKPVWLLVASIR
jgi:hypothetical protein